MNNTNQVHPIEFFLACLINLIEFICYIINDIAGHHQTTTNIVSGDQTTTTNTSDKAYSQEAANQATYQAWVDDITALTVKQLREVTGIKSSRYNKQALQQVALAGVTSYLH